MRSCLWFGGRTRLALRILFGKCGNFVPPCAVSPRGFGLWDLAC